MSEAAAPGAPLEPRHDSALVLDELEERLARFQLLRKSDAAAADEVLEEIGAAGPVERQIVLELSSPAPLGHRERFAEAHALTMRSLEVLDRNGARAVTLRRRLGPLTPPAAFLVQLVARFIVRSYQADVVDAVRHLYARREAACLAGDPARPLLTRARIHADRVAPGYKRNPLGVPTFLLGGAFVSSLLSPVRGVGSLVGASRAVAIAATMVVALVFLAGSWVILQGAAVARRRIRLTTQGPLDALWETVGRAGNPPRDQARTFALGAIALTALAWFVAPIGVAVVLALL